MNIRKEFKTIILPIIKGLPLTLTLVVIAFVITRRMIVYTNEVYQADGAIKIDTKDHSINANILFDEGGGKSAHNFLTEVESFKSKTLIKNTLKQLNYHISYYRVGDLKTTELYRNAPFSIKYATSAKTAYDRPFFLQYLGGDLFLFDTNPEFENSQDTLAFDCLFIHDQLVMTLHPEPEVLEKHPTSLQIGDIFKFQLNSLDGLKSQINASNLFIKPIDKEIMVIKVYYQHEVPEKAAEFVNALMETYIASSQKRISDESATTLDFIDEQLVGISNQLKKAEGQLAGFKVANGILNARQETDATLKEIMQLDLQKVNYELQEEELTRLFEFLATGNDLKDFAPNFESLRDAVFRDAYLQAQDYELQKVDLANRFTPQSEELLTVQAKINNLRTFIHESVKTTLDNIVERRRLLEENITRISDAAQSIPDKQRQIVVMEREVKLNEAMYNLMMEKRMELAISKTAAVVGHQIIDRASVAKAPVAPNKALIYGLAIFFALTFGILLSFLNFFLFATVKTKEDLLELTTPIPLVGTVNKVRADDENPLNAFVNLYTSLEILHQKKANPKEGVLVAISSYVHNEGKTFTTVNLGKSLASSGKRVLLVDLDVFSPQLHRHFGLGNDRGLGAILKKDCTPKEAIAPTYLANLDLLSSGALQDVFAGIIFSTDSTAFLSQLKNYYDYILVDTTALLASVDAMPLMHQTDYNLVVVRSGFSKIRKVKMLPPLLEEFQLPNTFTVLNGIPFGKRYPIPKRTTRRKRVLEKVKTWF